MGDLGSELQRIHKPSLVLTKFWAAEIVDMLRVLRHKRVVHRDLKPENLVLSREGHLKLVDFDAAVVLSPDGQPLTDDKAFVGSRGYLAPEVNTQFGVTYAMDLWALGAMLYQLLVGRAPFSQAVLEHLQSFQYNWPQDLAVDPAGKDLVDKLLLLDPTERLGYEDLAEVQDHGFFETIDWATLRSGHPPCRHEFLRRQNRLSDSFSSGFSSDEGRKSDDLDAIEPTPMIGATFGRGVEDLKVFVPEKSPFSFQPKEPEPVRPKTAVNDVETGDSYLNLLPAAKFELNRGKDTLLQSLLPKDDTVLHSQNVSMKSRYPCLFFLNFCCASKKPARLVLSVANDAFYLSIINKKNNKIEYRKLVEEIDSVHLYKDYLCIKAGLKVITLRSHDLNAQWWCDVHIQQTAPLATELAPLMPPKKNEYMGYLNVGFKA
eukprot:Platyproteum_vivax@DN4904_c0_g1_i1.p1